MKAKIITLDNKAVGEISLKEEIFGLPSRKDILHRVVNWQLAKRQAGTHKAKTISEISGTTAKPFKQKGTGNARQGSKRAVHMRGGATVFGPVVRSHAHYLPKKIRSLGLKTALSVKLASGKLFVLKEAKLAEAKTALLAKSFKELGWTSALIIDGATVDANFVKAANNIKNIDVLPTQGANVYDILRRDNLILTEEAVKKLEERLA